MNALHKRFGINRRTLARWCALGGITEKRIDRHVKAREELVAYARCAAQAIANGVPRSTYSMRVAREWSPERAATTPPDPRFRTAAEVQKERA